MTNNTTNRWPAVAGLIAAPFYLALIITLGALEPGYNHLTTMMSLLGGVPGTRGFAFNLGVATTGVLVISFGFGLWRQLLASSAARIGIGLLVIGGLGLIAAGYFHCNEGCRNVLTEPDLVGRLHIIVSLIAGMGTALAPLFIWIAMRHNEKWKGFAIPTLVTAILANLPGITLWITFFTDYRLLTVEGLIQRLGFVVALIWIFFVAARLWQLTSHDE